MELHATALDRLEEIIRAVEAAHAVSCDDGARAWEKSLPNLRNALRDSRAQWAQCREKAANLAEAQADALVINSAAIIERMESPADEPGPGIGDWGSGSRDLAQMSGADCPIPDPPSLYRDSLSPLYSLLPMDDADFREIVEQFGQRLRDRLAEMQRAIDRQDFQELARLAHWLKGAGGTAGFPVLTQRAKDMEAHVRDQQMAEIDVVLGQLVTLSQRIAIPPLATAADPELRMSGEK